MIITFVLSIWTLSFFVISLWICYKLQCFCSLLAPIKRKPRERCGFFNLFYSVACFWIDRNKIWSFFSFIFQMDGHFFFMIWTYFHIFWYSWGFLRFDNTSQYLKLSTKMKTSWFAYQLGPYIAIFGHSSSTLLVFCSCCSFTFPHSHIFIHLLQFHLLQFYLLQFYCSSNAMPAYFIHIHAH